METFGAATVGTVGRWKRSDRRHDTLDGRHDTSDASCIVARTALLGSFFWWVSSPILSLSTARDSDRSVRRSPCSATRKWVWCGHTLDSAHNLEILFLRSFARLIWPKPDECEPGVDKTVLYCPCADCISERLVKTLRKSVSTLPMPQKMAVSRIMKGGKRK